MARSAAGGAAAHTADFRGFDRYSRVSIRSVLPKTRRLLPAVGRRFRPASASALDDSGLMAAVSAGERAAFAELYDRFGTRAYHVAYSVCGDQGRAEDAVQEAFVSIWQTRMSYRPPPGTVAAWLLSSVRRRALDIASRNESPAGPRPPTLLARLADTHQEVITLALCGELTHTEIAAQLELPVDSVKAQMRLGLKQLRAAAASA
jgi:RNA polymerase sigma-70 factor, ECF subfamily